MQRALIAGATALTIIALPAQASAAPVSPFSGTAVTATATTLVVAVRNGRRDGNRKTVTVTPAKGAVVKLDGKVVPVARIPAAARVSVGAGNTSGATIVATEIIATR